MNWTIPGTTLQMEREEASRIADRFGSMFLAGGMVLSQVTAISGLDAYMIQNWVKRGFLSKPIGKRYTLRQLCRILNINTLKGILQLDQICGLLSYVNGALDDESDDLIDDADLFFMFVGIAAKTSDYSVDSPKKRDELIHESMKDYREPIPGAKDRVEKVLRIMLTAYGASMLQKAAMEMLPEIQVKE